MRPVTLAAPAAIPISDALVLETNPNAVDLPEEDATSNRLADNSPDTAV
jgi:hypothetical protein